MIMSWNDGVSKELNDYFDGIEHVCADLRGVAEKVIDEKANAFYEQVENKTPYDSGGLKDAWEMKSIKDRGGGFYGYSAEFKGETLDGQPYQKIANVLNYGRKARKGYFSGTFFVTKAIKKLKGMSGEIEAAIEKELTKKV